MITLVEGNNELNVQLTPVAAPTPLATLYGTVIENGIPVPNVIVQVAGYSVTTNSVGYYSISNLPLSTEFGMYAVSISWFHTEIELVEGLNRLDIDLGNPALGLTIDSFRVRLVSPGVVESEFTITNHTGKTLIGMTPPYAVQSNVLSAEGYAGGISEDTDIGQLISFGVHSPNNIGDITPGTHVYTGQVDHTRDFAFRAGWLDPGAVCVAQLSAFHGDDGGGPPYIAEKVVSGTFSYDWQTWK